MSCFTCLNAGMHPQDRFLLTCRLNADHYLNDDLSLKRCMHHESTSTSTDSSSSHHQHHLPHLPLHFHHHNSNSNGSGNSTSTTPASETDTTDSGASTPLSVSASSSTSTTPSKHHPNRPDMRRLNACISKFHRLHAQTGMDASGANAKEEREGEEA